MYPIAPKELRAAPKKWYRFGIRTLLLVTLLGSLAMGAEAWVVQGPDAGVEDRFDAAAEWIQDTEDFNLAIGLALLTPAVVLGGWFAALITLVKVKQCPYALLLVLAFAASGVVACVFWFVELRWSGSGWELIAARMSLPLAMAAVATTVETTLRRLPSPYWVISGLSLLMAASYTGFIIGVWACGGKQ